jgi:hypothetical protein
MQRRVVSQKLAVFPMVLTASIIREIKSQRPDNGGPLNRKSVSDFKLRSIWKTSSYCPLREHKIKLSNLISNLDPGTGYPD